MYNADVRKLYDLKDPAWKYDILPEIIDGHNVSHVARSALCACALGGG